MVLCSDKIEPHSRVMVKVQLNELGIRNENIKSLIFTKNTLTTNIIQFE